MSCKGTGYNSYEGRKIQKSMPWTHLQRMNRTYAILRARRAKMSDDDGRKDGIMLSRCRALLAKIKKADEEEAIRAKGYANAAELSDGELKVIYGRSVNNNHQCEADDMCFCCICGQVLEDRKAGKEQAFAFVE